MEFDLYKDIQKRTNGEIYIGVVGPVRTGKSTFIKRFMDLFVLPYIEDEDMPHITIKMLKGRTDEQKKKAADQVAAALVEAIGCNPDHISVAVEDFTPVEWQDEFRKEVTESSHIYKEPNYDPKDVL